MSQTNQTCLLKFIKNQIIQFIENNSPLYHFKEAKLKSHFLFVDNLCKTVTVNKNKSLYVNRAQNPVIISKELIAGAQKFQFNHRKSCYSPLYCRFESVCRVY